MSRDRVVIFSLLGSLCILNLWLRELFSHYSFIYSSLFSFWYSYIVFFFRISYCFLEFIFPCLNYPYFIACFVVFPLKYLAYWSYVLKFLARKL
jgi:hypothetical protein